MIQRALTTKADVKKFSGLGAAFPPCEVRDIFQIEYNYFLTCLGIDFWADLWATKADYSESVVWSEGLAVAEGSVVQHGKTYWISKTATATEPVFENEYWGLAPIFSGGECAELYNTAWCLFVGELVSLQVYMYLIGRNTAKVTAQGVTVNYGEDFQAASTGQRQVLIDTIRTQFNVVERNFKHWVNNNNANGCFDTCLLVENANKCGCKDEGGCSDNFPYMSF